jgi:hypothetical protein
MDGCKTLKTRKAFFLLVVAFEPDWMLQENC